MNGLFVGGTLIAAGIVLFLFSKRGRKTTASSGSVAVGGDNRGSIVNTSHAPPANESHGTKLTAIAIFVETIGIAVTLWHAYHMYYS